MTQPPDHISRPARPTRRFSALQPPLRRSAATATPAVIPADDAPPPPVVTPAPAVVAAKPEPHGDEARVAKVMARAGLCSRREAEGWILAGRVAVNGTVLDSPALNIGPADEITVDGYPIEKPEHTRLFMFHKTRGLVTTAKDPEGRPTIYDALPDSLPRLITIGRLDINTEGLLLLTNDGGLARLLELPSTGWLRRYRVRANGRVDQGQLDALAKGITVDGVDYVGIDAKLDRIQGANLWMTLGLREGKNREVKRVLEHLGLSVSRLIRISFGPFQLGDLAENATEEVRTRVLRDQLGSTLARQAGLDLDRSDEGARAPEERPGDRPRAKSRGKQAARDAVPDEPRRATKRTATADRKGRAVAVERISTVSRATDQTRAPRTSASHRPDRNGAAERASGRGERRPAQSEARPGGRDERPAGRPARTLRQADAGFRRPDRDDRAARPAGDERGRPTRGERPVRAERPTRNERSSRDERPSRSERPDRPAAHQSAGDRPREGNARPRNETPRAPRDGAPRPFRDGPARGRSEGAPRPQRNGGPGAARSDRGAGLRSEAGGRSDERRGGADRPNRAGGKPGFKGAPRSGGGKPSGGSGRGRPRP